MILLLFIIIITDKIVISRLLIINLKRLYSWRLVPNLFLLTLFDKESQYHKSPL